MRILRPHVVAVEYAEIALKAVASRVEINFITQVPFTSHGSEVAVLTHDLRQGDLAGVEPFITSGGKNFFHADSCGVAAGHECRA